MPIITSELFEFIANKFAIHPNGSDCWWEEPISSLLPPSLVYLAPNLRKGFDTLDCWLDSGTAWSLLQESLLSSEVNANSLYPSDVLIEGTIILFKPFILGVDQLRGWFQSMLLTSVGAFDKIPFKRCIIHGFVLDEQGQKMSKSIGNVIDPSTIIDKYGLDTLRFWVASSDYRTDIKIGPSILSTVIETKNKLRNTIKFLLSNLSDLSKLAITSSNLVSGNTSNYTPSTHATTSILPSYSMLFSVNDTID